MNFTVDQQAYLQGFLPVQQMYLWHLSGGLLGPADTDTSRAYVTKDNIDLYLGKSRFMGTVQRRADVEFVGLGTFRRRPVRSFENGGAEA